jgi:hypothetical protein
MAIKCTQRRKAEGGFILFDSQSTSCETFCVCPFVLSSSVHSSFLSLSIYKTIVVVKSSPSSSYTKGTGRVINQRCPSRAQTKKATSDAVAERKPSEKKQLDKMRKTILWL